MTELESLQEKLNLELDEKKKEDDEKDTDFEKDFDEPEIEDEDKDDEDDDEEKKKGNSKVRIETTTKINGIIRNLDYEIFFQDFADKVNDEVSGVVLTRAKAKEVFKIFKKMMGF